MKSAMMMSAIVVLCSVPAVPVDAGEDDSVRAVRARGTAAIWGVPDFTRQVNATDAAMVSLYGSTQLAAGQPGQGPPRNSVTRFGRLTVDPSYDFGLQNSRVLGLM